MMTERYRNGRAAGAGCDCALRNRECITELRPAQAWALYEIGIADGLLGPLGVGHGKCLNDSEYLDYSRGERRHVSQPAATIAVASFDRTLRIAPASAFASGSKHCQELRLADGAKIRASDDHPILTSRGWVPTVRLVEGDFVAVAVEVPEPPPRALALATDAAVIMNAYQLSDGGCTGSMLRFTNMTPAIICEWQDCCHRVAGGWTEQKSPSRARQFCVLQSGAFRREWGLYGLSKNKRCHPSIWGLPRRQVALFLNRFWACDGHISKQAVECTLASEGLIDDLRFLCTRLGIRTRKQFRSASYVKGGTRHHFDAWRITAYGAAALKFLDEVGDVLGKENACQALRTRLQDTRRNTNHDVVPIGRKELQEICDELGMPGRGGVRKSGTPRSNVRRYFGATAGQYVSRERFVEFCRDYSYRGKYSHLATTDVAWERVVSVTPIGIQPVYDLTVPGTHNFVANGIVVHNTLLDLLSPLAFKNCERALLLVPPTLIDQLIAEYELVSNHFRVPGLIEQSRGYRNPVDSLPTLYVFSYNRLSNESGAVFMEWLKPDVVIMDEAHSLRHASAVRTGRVLRFFKKEPKTRAAAWSGSLTDSTIRDYAHLSRMTLGDGSPLPHDEQVLAEWAMAIDPGEFQAPAGALFDLCEPGEHVVEGYHRRLVETIGVVATTSPAVDAELSITERAAPALPATVEAALNSLRATWTRPDGEELVDALSLGRCARELASGFYYRWVFPRGEPVTQILRWLEFRKEWRCELRRKLQQKQEHLDSPLLCAKAAARAWGDVPPNPELPIWRAQSWPAWRDIKNTVQYETQAVRLHRFLAEDAAKWGQENRGIVWYEHRAFGEWVAEISGLPLHGGGADAGPRIARETGDRSIVASLKSHGTGRDGLQRIFDRQLVANPPSSSTQWEQVLGRLHRIGQKSPVVHAEFYRHTEETASHVDSALARALYVETTLGSGQKLRMGWKLE